MRELSTSSPDDRSVGLSGVGLRDAESLFRNKPISEIRNVESATRKNIENKKEELRQLVGTRYRDLIDSADSIVLMKSSCETISANVSSIHNHILSLSSSPVSQAPKLSNTSPARVRVYGIACRVKYIVDTPENIWGCMDESMFLEAAGRYLRAKHAQQTLLSQGCGIEVDQAKILSNFPLLQHHLQIVESFRAQVSQKSRERLLERGLGIAAYTDALAAVSVIDELDPKQILSLFLDARKTWILQKLGSCPIDVTFSDIVSVFCDVLSVIQTSIGQVGELFLQVLNDRPLFYKIILSSPPASQLFGGIPNPDEEVRLWKSIRDKLETVMVALDKEYISKTCLSWLRDCGREIVHNINGRYLVEAIGSGIELGSAEKLIRATMDSKEVLKGSLEGRSGVFGSEIELPWSRIRELVLEDESDLWDEIFEGAFVQRMKSIIASKFEDLTKSVNVAEVVDSIGCSSNEKTDFQAYLSRPSSGGGIWFIESNRKKAGPNSGQKHSTEENDFLSCLNAYFGSEVNQIKEAVDRLCQNVLVDILSFLESPTAGARLKDLAPYVQNKCHESISKVIGELRIELDKLYSALKPEKNEGESAPPARIVERALFIGRLLFALQNHSKHIPLILGSPRFWSKEIDASGKKKLPSSVSRSSEMSLADSLLSDNFERQLQLSPRRHTSFLTAALLGTNENSTSKLAELNRAMQDLCIRAHSLWIQWLSDELSAILSQDLGKDEGLSATAPLRSWEEMTVKQEKFSESQADLKISLPSMPSLYIISFLCRACEEIHRIGGHVLDKSILQKFASILLEKIVAIYGDFLTARESNGPQVSDKGILQMLLDLRFAADVLSGGEVNFIEGPAKGSLTKPFRRNQERWQPKTATGEQVNGLIINLSQKLDPIDWQTFEPYLWENERQSYLRQAVLFGFFVQLNRMYTDTVQRLPTNSESNILQCSTIPRFKYLPISAPALSSRNANKGSFPATSVDALSRTSWEAYKSIDISGKIDMDENSSFNVAAPLLKSFMQVGSRFGESTLKLGSILTDSQVGIFKDRSASAMSTFGDILPAQAAGLLSSFTGTKPEM